VCLRQEMDIPAGQRYELCRSVHAEMNAVIHASRAQTLGASLYLAGVEVADGRPTEHPEPCLLCRRVILNAGIARVVVQPRGSGIISLDPQKWIDEENLAARQGLAAPPELVVLEPEKGTRGGSS